MPAHRHGLRWRADGPLARTAAAQAAPPLSLARRSQVSTTVSGLSDTDSMPSCISHSARSGWSEGPWPQMPTYLPLARAALIAIDSSFLTAGFRSSNRWATIEESRSRPSDSWVRSLEPIEKPSKISRNSSASRALDGMGARLGFWLRPRQEGAAQEEPARDGLLRRAGRWLGTTKFGLLASEALASFAGPCQDWWYLSDGGHFENTGVHALLQRQLDFIVLADCGADPRYEYDDLENLVRKARIDFDCDIEFWRGYG